MILDTFVSVFTADTANLKKGYEDTRKGADNVTTALKDTEQQANKTNSSLLEMAKKAAGFLAAAALAKSTIGTVIGKSAEIHAMNQTVETIGEAIEEVDAFKRTMQDNGASGEAVMGSLTNLFKASGQAAAESGGEQAKAFAAMGIAVKDVNGKVRSSVELMTELAGVADNLGAEQSVSYFEKLGITDQRVIETLLKGRKEMEASIGAHKELGGVTKETAEKAGKFDTAMNKLANGMERGSISLTDALLPAVTWVVNKLGDLVGWMVKNKTVVTGFFIAIAAVVATVFLPPMTAAAMATLAAIAPFLLIGAAIAVAAAAFALIYDDIMNFIDGNDSMIGQIMESYPALGAVIQGLFDIFSYVFNAIGDLMSWLSDTTGVSFDGIGGVIKAFIALLLGSLNQVAEWGIAIKGYFVDAADGIVAVFTWLVDKVKSALSFITGGIDKAKGAINFVAGKLGFGKDGEDGKKGQDNRLAPGDMSDIPVIDQVAAANAQINQASMNPLNATTSNAISNSVSSTNENTLTIGEIKIETQATDAKGVAGGVSSELRDQLKNLQMESSTGIAR